MCLFIDVWPPHGEMHNNKDFQSPAFARVLSCQIMAACGGDGGRAGWRDRESRVMMCRDYYFHKGLIPPRARALTSERHMQTSASKHRQTQRYRQAHIQTQTHSLSLSQSRTAGCRRTGGGGRAMFRLTCYVLMASSSSGNHSLLPSPLDSRCVCVCRPLTVRRG